MERVSLRITNSENNERIKGIMETVTKVCLAWPKVVQGIVFNRCLFDTIHFQAYRGAETLCIMVSIMNTNNSLVVLDDISSAMKAGW